VYLAACLYAGRSNDAVYDVLHRSRVLYHELRLSCTLLTGGRLVDTLPSIMGEGSK